MTLSYEDVQRTMAQVQAAVRKSWTDGEQRTQARATVEMESLEKVIRDSSEEELKQKI